MGDFLEYIRIQLNDIPEHIVSRLIDYSCQNSDQEVCGILYDKNDTLVFQPCENIAENNKISFLIDYSILIDYDVRYIFHSHCIGSSNPSSTDKKCCEYLNIPFIIYSVKENTFSFYNKSV